MDFDFEAIVAGRLAKIMIHVGNDFFEQRGPTAAFRVRAGIEPRGLAGEMVVRE